MIALSADWGRVRYMNQSKAEQFSKPIKGVGKLLKCVLLSADVSSHLKGGSKETVKAGARI